LSNKIVEYLLDDSVVEIKTKILKKIGFQIIRQTTRMVCGLGES